MELRLSPPLQLKLAPTALAEGEIAGLASTFGGTPDAYGDIIARGAYRNTLADHKARGSMPAMLWAHQQERPIGKWTSIEEDHRGLIVNGKFNLQTEAGREAHSHVKHGDVTGLSIGFDIAKNGRTFNGDGSATLTDLILHEVSAVAIPANSGARITSVKSIGTKREFEEALRDLGFPKAAAARLSAKGWAGLEDGDDTDEIDELVRAVKTSAQRLRKA